MTVQLQKATQYHSLLESSYGNIPSPDQTIAQMWSNGVWGGDADVSWILSCLHIRSLVWHFVSQSICTPHSGIVSNWLNIPRFSHCLVVQSM